jgi:hypothetical protein
MAAGSPAAIFVARARGGARSVAINDFLGHELCIDCGLLMLTQPAGPFPAGPNIWP